MNMTDILADKIMYKKFAENTSASFSYQNEKCLYTKEFGAFAENSLLVTFTPKINGTVRLRLQSSVGYEYIPLSVFNSSGEPLAENEKAPVIEVNAFNSYKIYSTRSETSTAKLGIFATVEDNSSQYFTIKE